MIDGGEKRNRQLAFELQNSHVCEKRSKMTLKRRPVEVSRRRGKGSKKEGGLARPSPPPQNALMEACSQGSHDMFY